MHANTAIFINSHLPLWQILPYWKWHSEAVEEQMNSDWCFDEQVLVGFSQDQLKSCLS